MYGHLNLTTHTLHITEHPLHHGPLQAICTVPMKWRHCKRYYAKHLCPRATSIIDALADCDSRFCMVFTIVNVIERYTFGLSTQQGCS